MADSIPSLRRKLDEANAEIKKLRLAKPEEKIIEKVVYVNKEVEVPGPERVVYVDREVTVPGPERVVYVNRDVPVPGPEKVVEVVKVVKEKGDTKVVEIPVEVEKPVYKQVEVEKVVYVDNPEHIRTIEKLQERLFECQNISQSASS